MHIVASMTWGGGKNNAETCNSVLQSVERWKTLGRLVVETYLDVDSAKLASESYPKKACVRIFHVPEVYYSPREARASLARVSQQLVI